MTPIPRVLMVGTYPIGVPRHGGQRRASAIEKSYRRAGWAVKYIGVFPYGSHKLATADKDNIFLPRTFVASLAQAGLRTDLHAHRYFTENTAAYRLFAAKISDFQPHVIQFEQPWLFPVLENYIRDHRRKLVVVYSSQNIERKLLQSILMAEGHPRAADFVRDAGRMEESVAAAADVTICVTDMDASFFRSLGVKNVLVAPNGADRRPPTMSATWETRLGSNPFALMVGSAHPPNCSGFLHFVGSEFAFVPPDAKVVVAGGMVRLLSASTAFHNNSEMVRRRTVLVKDPEECDLDWLLNRTTVVLLPISQGGGSNIKTAEALLTDRTIIGSSTAFRGFETYRNSAGVVIEDDVSRFRHAIRNALSAQHPSTATRIEAEKLLWENCVSDIPETIATYLRQ